MGDFISLYNTLQLTVLGFVWCTLSHYLFPKTMDNQLGKIHCSYTVILAVY